MTTNKEISLITLQGERRTRSRVDSALWTGQRKRRGDLQHLLGTYPWSQSSYLVPWNSRSRCPKETLRTRWIQINFALWVFCPKPGSVRGNLDEAICFQKPLRSLLWIIPVGMHCKGQIFICQGIHCNSIQGFQQRQINSMHSYLGIQPRQIPRC